MTPLPLRTTLALVYGVVLSLILTAEGYAHHAALKRQLDTSVTADLAVRGSAPRSTAEVGAAIRAQLGTP